MRVREERVRALSEKQNFQTARVREASPFRETPTRRGRLQKKMAVSSKAPGRPEDAAAAAAQSTTSIVISVASGSIAGAASKTVTAPVERVRLLLQMNKMAHTSTATTDVLKHEGARGLWRGNGLAITRAMLQKGLLFSTQDRLSTLLGYAALRDLMSRGVLPCD